MPPIPTLIFMVIFCLQSLVAMLQNGFMAIVLGREWMRSQAPQATDMIIACLALSRFCLHGSATLNNFLEFFGFCYQVNFFGIFWDFINTLILWLTTWLAMFYCVKISSFSYHVFFWLKWRISRLIPRLLLGSLIISGLSAIISASGNTIAAHFSHGNCTFGHKTLIFYRHYYLSHGVLMWLTPFFMFLVSIVLLIFSLSRHVGHMRDCRRGPYDSSTQAHTMALKSLAFFLIFYTMYFLSMVISIVSITPIQSLWYWAKELITYACISLHSVILVLSSPKLRKHFTEGFWVW
uniref:Taste receptor type 2 n=1 Tax=Castor canadensis TaxID=51338 RepID=A0A8C0WEA3_CASCN